MGIEDIAPSGITVMLDKPRALRLINRGYRALASAFGSVRFSIEALQAITPKSDIDGNVQSIEQDDKFYATMIAWLHAALSGDDKEITLDEVSELCDELPILDFISLRSAIWRAFAASMPQDKKADEENPTSSPTMEK